MTNSECLSSFPIILQGICDIQKEWYHRQNYKHIFRLKIGVNRLNSGKVK